jgi:hypothetical protein
MFRAGNPATGPRAGEHVRAVILPGGPPYTLAFFVNDEMERAENHDDMHLVLFRADEIKRSLLDDAWQEEE